MLLSFVFMAVMILEECLSPSEKRTYQAIIGSLGYLMNCGRPDLAFSVNKLAQFASCPADRHLIAAKRLLRYVRGRIDAYLIIGGSIPFELRAWFDASWADNPDDSRSTYGCHFVWAHHFDLEVSETQRRHTLNY